MAITNEAEFKNNVDSIINDLQELAQRTRITYLETITRLLREMKDTLHVPKSERDQRMSALFRCISDDEYDFLNSEIYKRMRLVMNEYHEGVG